MAPDSTGPTEGYVFAVRFRLDPDVRDVSVSPAAFETTMVRALDPPGESGWLFFRDNLWRGELTDPEHFRELTADALGVAVLDVSFRELRLTEASLDALREAMAADLAAFNADTVEEVLSKYLGSSVRVVEA